MDGTVSSFLPAKGYGFVRGDDGRDYFLHQSDLVPAFGVPIEGQRISFEETATPKGYRARRVKPLGSVGPVRYVVPDMVLQSRGSDIRGWEILASSLWTVHGSSRDSPDDAKALLLARVAKLGGNGAVGVGYYKSTGSEAGTGRGTHHFTIHNFRAHPVFVGRASTAGTVSRQDVASLDERASALKKELVSRTRSSTSGAIVAAVVVLVIAMMLVMAIGDFGSLIALVIGVIASIAVFRALDEDHDGWLQPPG